MAVIDELLELMVKEGASDLHVSSGYAPYLRIRGHMIKLNAAPLKPEKLTNYIFETMSENNQKIFMRKLEMGWSYRINGLARFRANAFFQQNGIAAVYRLVPERIKTLEELGLPEALRAFADYPKGLVLVTGPTGSGKSTTLAALINHINLTRNEHIITIEDPIEFLHVPKNRLINQREVSRHTKSFANALRGALREDPDVILVGEMRDLKTINLTLTAAETGHLVFATLHTNNAAKSIDRIVGSFPADHQEQISLMLSESLVGIVAQTLLPRADVKGMIPAVEVLTSNSAVRSLIRQNKTYQIPSVIQTSASAGMISFEQSISQLVKSGTISQVTASASLPELVSASDKAS